MADESVIFDTHRFITRLTAAGLAEPIAEALADEHAQLLARNLATKTDIEQLRAATQQALAALRSETQAGLATVHKEIADTKVEIIKWNVGTLLALAALGVAALAAWPQ